jgi:PTH1 family peptidyl-tRNA hydrolase
VGLGNPGQEYEDTRHNAGFMLADHIARRWGLGSFRRGDRARVAEGQWQGESVQLLKPQTYMNRSGAALAKFLGGSFDPATELLVLVDDVAIAAGRFRLRGAGSAGGHNGLKSIEATLQRQDYARLRIGVGPQPTSGDLADYVLAPLTSEEHDLIDPLLDPMTDAAESWLTEGIERAMTRFNKGS